jgi:hypothetical protein
VVWIVIGVACAIRIAVIWRGFFWQDDYIHIWTAWNAPAGELILQNWNGHREPAAFAIQWLLARAAPQIWWPAAVVLSAIAVATTVGFWLMLRRWGANPLAGMLFAAWPATLVAQQWLSAGLETVPLLLMCAAGYLLARPARWTPLWVGLLAATAWLFHERAVYIAPVLFAIAVFYSGPRAWRDNRGSWLVLSAVTACALVLRAWDARPGQTGGTSVPGAFWTAGPGSVLGSVLGWLPFDGHSVVPRNPGLWAVAVLAVWMALLVTGVALRPRQTLLVAGVTAGFLAVEVLSFVALRGGFAGSLLAADPRFTLVTGTVLIAGLGTFAWPAWTGAVSLLGCAGMLAYPATPGRDWFRPLPPGVELAATPSPPEMLGHFFFTTRGPRVELGTTRTLLQVGPSPPAFPEVSRRPQQVTTDGRVTPLRFTPLLADPRRQCGVIDVPDLDAGVRVVRLDLLEPGPVNGVVVPAGPVFVLPPPGPVRLTGPCTDGVVVGIPGR